MPTRDKLGKTSPSFAVTRSLTSGKEKDPPIGGGIVGGCKPATRGAHHVWRPDVAIVPQQRGLSSPNAGAPGSRRHRGVLGKIFPNSFGAISLSPRLVFAEK